MVHPITSITEGFPDESLPPFATLETRLSTPDGHTIEITRQMPGWIDRKERTASVALTLNIMADEVTEALAAHYRRSPDPS